MTELEKELLFTDLCSRVPYKPMLQIYLEDMNSDGYFNEELESVDNFTGANSMYANDRWIENVKVYLRPMSSMTEEEREEERKLWNIVTTTRNDLHYLYTDFLLSHHLDYRGLIKKGLALEAPEEMYN